MDDRLVLVDILQFGGSELPAAVQEIVLSIKIYTGQAEVVIPVPYVHLRQRHRYLVVDTVRCPHAVHFRPVKRRAYEMDTVFRRYLEYILREKKFLGSFAGK